MNNLYHIAVLLHESIEALNIKPDGIYVDVTFGGGGHSKAILDQLTTGQLIGFDQDEDALNNALLDNRFLLIRQNFRYMQKFLRVRGITQVDGILADLGVSSWQFDQAERGFSIRMDALLDMRMDKSAKLTAADVVNTYSEVHLQTLLSNYGEVRNAKQLAHAIVNARDFGVIKTTQNLIAIADTVVKGERHRYLAQLFQAIRMEVNDELGALTQLLESTFSTLKPGGRLVVISYHSLEDRIVKNVMKTGNAKGEMQTDFMGRSEKYFTVITKKPILPSANEQKENKRSRSAKLRIAQK